MDAGRHQHLVLCARVCVCKCSVQPDSLWRWMQGGTSTLSCVLVCMLVCVNVQCCQALCGGAYACVCVPVARAHVCVSALEAMRDFALQHTVC